MFCTSGCDFDLWADVIQFTVGQSPQYLLCRITTHAKVESVKRREQLPPYLQKTTKKKKTKPQKEPVSVHSVCQYTCKFLGNVYKTKHQNVCEQLYLKLVHELN